MVLAIRQVTQVEVAAGLLPAVLLLAQEYLAKAIRVVQAGLLRQVQVAVELELQEDILGV